MSDSTKPSSSEDEYHHKQDQERLAKRRAEAEAANAAEARDALRQLHYMHCPKCGAHLATETYHRVQVDRCPECHGVWFDAGEAESLLDKEPGTFAKLFGDVIGAGKKKK